LRLSLDARIDLTQVIHMRGRILIVAGLLLCASSGATAADEQPICPTRPNKSTAPCTVPAGHFQIETGVADWSLQNNGGERDTSLAIGETTFKYGLTDRSDIELDVTPWQRVTSSAGAMHQNASGFGDLVASYKLELTAANAPLQLTLLPSVKIPTAKHPLGNGKWEGRLLVPIQYSIPKSPLALSFTPELDWVADGDGHGHHLAMVQVIDLGWQVTPKLSLSGELWGQWDWDPAGTTPQYSTNGAIAYLVSNDVQLDAGANFGLNRYTPDVELYTGVSVRF
jgi:outer membrane putative beta-barrel porin/alpha-amylase